MSKFASDNAKTGRKPVRSRPGRMSASNIATRIFDALDRQRPFLGSAFQLKQCANQFECQAG
jgi:hypothetical protein